MLLEILLVLRIIVVLRTKLSVVLKRDHLRQEAVMLCKPTSGFTFSFADFDLR